MIGKFYTANDLKNLNNTSNNYLIQDLLPNIGLYLFIGAPKLGKTMLCNALGFSVATGVDFLGYPTQKGLVLYFDLDNYSTECAKRIKVLGVDTTNDIKYFFNTEENDISSLDKIIEIINTFSELKKVRLIIIDSLINIRDFQKIDLNKYSEVYPLIIKLRDFLVKNNLLGIVIHHTNKSNSTGQNSILGSQGIAGSVSGTIKLFAEDEFSKTGELQIIARSSKKIIPLKKREDDVVWIENIDNDNTRIDIDENVLKIINGLIKIDENKICANCQQIVTTFDLKINPSGLYKFLIKNKEVLKENHCSFSKHRTSSTRFIKIELDMTTDDLIDSKIIENTVNDVDISQFIKAFINLENIILHMQYKVFIPKIENNILKNRSIMQLSIIYINRNERKK